MKSLLLIGWVALLCAIASAEDAPPVTGESSAKDPLEDARAVQQKVDANQEELMHKIQELEAEYRKKADPLAAERGDLLKGIKNFWSTVLLAHPSHGMWIQSSDKEILQNHLTDVRIETISENDIHGLGTSHYRVSLHFSPNHYFSDSVLWREVNGIAEDDTAKMSGITWTDGSVPSGPSFFNFFEAKNVRPEMMDGHLFNDIAHVFRYEFWPNPFSYYDLPTTDFSRHQQEHEEYLRSLEQANGAEGGIPADGGDYPPGVGESEEHIFTEGEANAEEQPVAADVPATEDAATPPAEGEDTPKSESKEL